MIRLLNHRCTCRVEFRQTLWQYKELLKVYLLFKRRKWHWWRCNDPKDAIIWQVMRQLQWNNNGLYRGLASGVACVINVEGEKLYCATTLTWTFFFFFPTLASITYLGHGNSDKSLFLLFTAPSIRVSRTSFGGMCLQQPCRYEIIVLYSEKTMDFMAAPHYFEIKEKLNWITRTYVESP